MKYKTFSYLFLSLLFLSANLAIHAQTIEVLIKNAEAAIERRDYEAALKNLGAALAKQPQNADALTHRARVYFFQNKMEEAFGETNKILAANPKNAVILNLRGLIKRNFKKDYAGALEDFGAALAVDPNFVKALINRADLLRAFNRFEQSLTDASKAIEIEPGNATARLTRARIYFDSKKYPEAVADFNKAINLDAGCSNCYAERSRAKGHINPPTTTEPIASAAEAWLADILSDAEKALSLDPNNWLAMFARGFVNHQKKNYAAAWKDFYAVYRAAPLYQDNRNWMKSMASKAGQAGSLPQVVEIINEAKAEFEKDFSDLKAAENLEWAYTLVGKKENSSEKLIDETYRSYLIWLANKNPNSACLTYLSSAGEVQNSYKLERAVGNYDKARESKCAALAANQVAVIYILKTNACQDCLMQAESLANLNTAMDWANKALAISPNLPEAVKTKNNILGWLKRRENLIAERDKAKTPTNSGNAATTAIGKTNNAEENALVSEYNRLVSANIPRLDSQRRSLQSKVSDYMSANKMARVWMHRGVYNYCSSVINSHEAFITSLNNLLKRAYGKSPRLVSEIESQIRSVESGVERLKQIRYGLVNAL